MPERKEQELQKPVREISLGEDFHPFDPAENKIDKGNAYGGVNQLSSHIILFADTNLKLPLDIVAFPGISPKTHAITPFDPEVGYQITYEDLNWQSRIKKFERLSREESEFIEFSKAPLYLKVTDFPFKWTSSVPEERTILDSLRLFVWFPKGSFEGKPHTANVPDSSFAMFYPQDTGPLPVGDFINIYLRTGFYLHLPSDPEKLAQIRARFVLADELEEQPRKP